MSNVLLCMDFEFLPTVIIYTAV